MTAALLITGDDGTARYASAGHRRALRLRADTGAIDSWDTDGILLGIYDTASMPAPITQLEARIQTGDRVFLFTDGVTDVKNSNGERFGEERIVRLLQETRHLEAAVARDVFLESWQDFFRRGAREDDCTFALLQF